MRYSLMARPVLAVVLTLATFALASCVDAPSAPDGTEAGGKSLVIAPVFALVGPGGSVPTGAQITALEEAFDQVDRFRMVVTRVPGGQVVADVFITVTPGQPEYDLSVEVPVQGASEQFEVRITALKGTVELFTSLPIPVTASPPAAGANTPPPAAVEVKLQYSGPGTTATSVVLSPAQAVLAPGGTVQLAARVLDDAGQPIADVALAWVNGAPAVATVSGTGAVNAVGDGKTQITVATPTGLQASAWIYVLGGELAYVEGGDLKVRAPAGGTASVRASGGASMPAWTADGAKLYYSADGQVRLAGGGALGAGAWPAPSPDGAKIVVDGMTFFNDDGSNRTSGPSGSTPLWLDDATLLVGGGSLQSVRADGSGRTTIVAGDASLPALSGSSLAYISDGALKIQGRTEPLLTGASGRPTWSADGRWLVVSAGSGLTLVPSDGAAPAVPLPGLTGASQPAFRPGGALGAPLTPRVTGFGPDGPRPGQVVTLVGTGFDWIIPANTRVTWPVGGARVEGNVEKVTATEIQVFMPTNVTEGSILVTGYQTQPFALQYTPAVATLNVTAVTPWGAVVAGMVVVVKNASGATLGQATTDQEGLATIAGVEPGDVTIEVTAPAGYKLTGDSPIKRTLPTGPSALSLVATPQVKSVKLTPEKPSLGILDEAVVTVEPLDVNGVPIPEIKSISWASASSKLDVWEGGLSTTIVGKQPSAAQGDAGFSVTLDGQVFGFAATVTSSIAGTVTQDPAPVGAPATVDAPAAVEASGEGPTPTAAPSEPAPNVTVNVMQGEKKVATAITSAKGTYVVTGLLAGTYDMSAVAKGDYASEPVSQAVTLNAANPTGTADFHMSLGTTDHLVVSASETPLSALGAQSDVTFQAYDEDDVLLGPRAATYESTDTEVLTVDEDGKVTAIDNGSAWVRVTVEGVKDSVLVTVDQQAVALQLFKDVGEPAPDSARFLVQEEFQILYEAKDANGHLIPSSHRKPTYTPDTGKLAIDADGNAVASASDVGRQVVIVTMDAAGDTLIVWVLGVRVGDFDVNTDMAVMDDSLYGQIQGTLWVDGSGLTDLDGLSTLFEVWGDVNIRDNPSLVDVSGLRNIEEIGGTLRIKRNAVLATPAVPPSALHHIGGNLKIWDNPLITNVDAFANLESVNGYIDIMGNPSLADVDGFAALEIARGLALESNQVLTAPAGFPALEWLGWDGLYIDEGATVARFPSLKGTEGEVTVGGEVFSLNPIESLDFPSLQCVEVGIWIYDNDNLAQAKFPALDHVGNCDTPFDPDEGYPPPVSSAFRAPSANRVTVTPRPDPDQRDPRSLESRKARQKTMSQRARDEFRQRSAGADAQRDAVRSQSRAERAARRGPAKPARAPRPRPQQFSEPAAYSEGGSGLAVENNPLLAQLDLGALRHVEGDLSLANNDLGALTIPLLETIGSDLNIYSSGLVTLSLPEFVSVGDDIWIESTTEFERLLAPKLESVGDDFYVDYNDALGDFVLESLKSIGFAIKLYSNTWDGVLRLPKLETVVSDVYVEDNTGLTSVEIATASLLAVGYYFEIEDNDGLLSLNVPGADHLYYFTVGYNPDLVSINAATAATLEVEYDFDIFHNDLLQTINIPGLASAYYLDIDYNANLMTVDLATTADLTVGWRFNVSYNPVPHPWTLSVPRLVNVNSGYVSGYVQIHNNGGLETVTMATSTPATFGGQLEVSSNNELETFNASALTAIGGNTNFYVNPALTSLSLGSLSAIGGQLQIEQTGLTNLGAFAGLTSALTSLVIDNNPALTNVTGLNGIGSAAGADPVISGYLSIQDNAALCDTDASALHSLLEEKWTGTAVGGSVVIMNNELCG